MKIIESFFFGKDGKPIKEKGEWCAFGEVYIERDDGEVDIVMIGRIGVIAKAPPDDRPKRKYTKEELDRMEAAETLEELLAAVDGDDDDTEDPVGDVEG